MIGALLSHDCPCDFTTAGKTNGDFQKRIESGAILFAKSVHDADIAFFPHEKLQFILLRLKLQK